MKYDCPRMKGYVLQKIDLVCFTLTRRCLLPWLVAVALGAFLTGSAALAQDASPPPEGEAGVVEDRAPEAATADPMQLVSVDWVEEMIQGGTTMLFLGLLSVFLLAFTVERMVVLRRSRFVPLGLADKIRPLFLDRQYDRVLSELNKHPSTLSRVVAYMVNHRRADPQVVAQTAGDVGAREMLDQEQRTMPFAVIAAMAPLLGLLGTMIGMIESFKLVEVFGDEGGASLLAGSISKALITTAVGLILAIPAIALYHWFKHRVHVITQDLETQTEMLFSAWFVTVDPPRSSDSGSTKGSRDSVSPPSTDAKPHVDRGASPGDAAKTTNRAPRPTA